MKEITTNTDKFCIFRTISQSSRTNSLIHVGPNANCASLWDTSRIVTNKRSNKRIKWAFSCVFADNTMPPPHATITIAAPAPHAPRRYNRRHRVAPAPRAPPRHRNRRPSAPPPSPWPPRRPCAPAPRRPGAPAPRRPSAPAPGKNTPCKVGGVFQRSQPQTYQITIPNNKDMKKQCKTIESKENLLKV